MSATAAGERVVVVGAGLAGSAIAAFLARRGMAVSLYERRPDFRSATSGSGRSINLGLSARGLATLRRLGLAEAALARSVPMHGRMIHSRKGPLRFHAYGTDPGHVLHSIERTDLNRLLLENAASHDETELHFGRTLVEVDKQSRRLVFRDPDGALEEIPAARVIAADGAFSATRRCLQRNERADFRQEFLPWGYKELTLPAGADGSSLIELEALHVWPRRDALMVSHPNVSGSHTLSLFAPFEGGRVALSSLVDTAAAERALAILFPDLLELAPELVDQLVERSTGNLVTITTAPWHWRDWAVLIGDACHAVYPFYGQGMNAALEDTAVLDELIGERLEAEGWQAVLTGFERRRRPHTDSLTQLSKDNFVELSTHLDSPLFVLAKKADVGLARVFPRWWKSLYTMVSHTTTPYADAVARGRRQRRALIWGAVALAAAAAGGLAYHHALGRDRCAPSVPPSPPRSQR